MYAGRSILSIITDMKFDLEEMGKVFGNTLSQVAVRFSGTITTFIATLLIVSFMGISSLGSFVTITSFVALFYLLIDFGLNTIYLKDYFKDTEEFFGNLVLLRFLLSSAVFSVVILLVFLIPTGFTYGLSIQNKLGIMIFASTLFTEGILVSFTGLTQKKLLQKLLLFPSIVSSIVVLGCVYYGVISSSMFLILLAYPIGELTQIILTYFTIRRQIVFKLLPVSFYSFSKTALFAAAPLALMLFLNVVYFRVDTIILAFYKSASDVGAYGFAYKIFEFLLVFPTFLSASVFPLLILHKENLTEFHKRVKSYSLILFGSSIILGIFVFSLSPFIVYIKPDLETAILPLKILSFSLPFFFLTSLFQWVLLLRRKVRILIGTYLFTMIINVILNLLYIPQFSYLAAATVTVITEGIVFLCMIGVLAGRHKA